MVGIVIVAAPGVGVYFLTRGEEVLPVYPGATKSLLDFEKLTGKSLPAGLDLTLYTVDASVDDIVDWYNAKMPERGWTKIGDNQYNAGRILGYMKGDKVTGILAIDWAGQIFLLLMHGPFEAWKQF